MNEGTKAMGIKKALEKRKLAKILPFEIGSKIEVYVSKRKNGNYFLILQPSDFIYKSEESGKCKKICEMIFDENSLCLLKAIDSVEFKEVVKF
jgi:hypothetical protein